MKNKPARIPPKLARRLLHLFLRDNLAEEVEGDLEEQFFAKLEETTPTKANLNYWYQVLNYLRPFAIRKSKRLHLDHYTMFRHNFLLTYRSFKRYRMSFFINLTGLSTGLACALLIYLWINNELSVDKFHEALSKIEVVFKKYVPYQPFDYKFVDQEYSKKFINEIRIGNLASVFALLAIFISCLGLFGLASYVAERRTKEIGIRKVIGASIFSLWKMLSKDFVVLVLLANFIASPIAYFFLSGWLEDYEYRIEITWWIFALTGMSTLLITVLTVSYQAVKVALTNPIKSLKSE